MRFTLIKYMHKEMFLPQNVFPAWIQKHTEKTWRLFVDETSLMLTSRLVYENMSSLHHSNKPPAKTIFLPFDSVLRKAKEECFSYKEVLLYTNTNARRLKTFLHMNILQSNCIPRVQKLYSHFPWIRLNIQRFLFCFLSLNCCDEKGHWDIYSERGTTDRAREKTERGRVKIDRDRVGKRRANVKEKKAETERQRAAAV